MAETLKANMIVPDVWADMVQAQFTGKMVLGGLATIDNILQGKPGDTVHFPKFNTLTDAAELTEAVAMTTEALTTSDSTATIKEAGKAVEISDTAILTAYGDPLAEIRRQLGVVVARKIDVDIKADAEASALQQDGFATGVVSANQIADALGKFGDDAEPDDFAGIVIHSKQRTDLFKDANFQRYDGSGDRNVVARGVIGDVFGIPVFVSDRITEYDYDGGGTGTEIAYKSLVIKRGALGLLYKRRPIVETDRDILKRTTVVTTNVHYATKLMNNSGVAVLITK